MSGLLIFSVTLLLVCLAGLVFTLSAALNIYQQKKLEYIAYRNQAKSKSILENSKEEVYENEETYYKTHSDDKEPVVDINFVTRAIPADLLNFKTYSTHINNLTSGIEQALKRRDYSLLWSEFKLNLAKYFKNTRQKALEFYSFLIKLTEPVDEKELQDVKMSKSTRSAVATSSRIKNLNRAFLKFTGQGQEYIKSRFSKTKVSTWSDSQEEILMDDISENRETGAISATQEVYEDLEAKILEKLHNNLTDFDLWESLGDFYVNNNEQDKAKEVYGYILKHSEDQNQKLRIRQKFN